MYGTLSGSSQGAVRRLASFRLCQSGAALVEFAFAAPIVILLTIGTFDLGRAVWLDVTLQHAAKEAVRFASLRGSESLSPASDADIEAFVLGRAVGVPAAALAIDVNWSPNNSSGSTVQVNLSYGYESFLQSWLPIRPWLLQGSASRIVL
ncbi:MAG: TadE/TadG family type IV pilus assembly protein [Kiloniellales bacterium]